MLDFYRQLLLKSLFAGVLLFFIGFIYRIYFVYPEINLSKSKLGLKINSSSLMVDDVYNKGIAYNAGIRKGDVILKADEKKIDNVRMFEETVNSNFGKEMTIGVLRGRQMLYFWVKMNR